jgi:hypothetical protein
MYDKKQRIRWRRRKRRRRRNRRRRRRRNKKGCLEVLGGGWRKRK